MIAHEPDGNDQERPPTLAREIGHQGARLWPEPGLRRGARALIGEVPHVQSGALCHGRGARSQLGRVGIAARENPLGEAVRGEQHLHRGGRWEPLQGLRYATGDGGEKLRVLAPAPHQRDLEPPGRGGEQLLLIRAHRHRGIVRGQHDPHQAPLARGDDLLDAVGDVGTPMTHADAHREAVAQQSLDPRRLRFGELAQR